MEMMNALEYDRRKFYLKEILVKSKSIITMSLLVYLFLVFFNGIYTTYLYSENILKKKNYYIIMTMKIVLTLILLIFWLFVRKSIVGTRDIILSLLFYIYFFIYQSTIIILLFKNMFKHIKTSTKFLNGI